METWIQKGVEVTSLYDPMLAKLIVHGSDRADAIAKMERVLKDSRVYGITSNMQYLAALLKTETYQTGALFTGMLKDFMPQEHAIEVLDGGVQTTVQDYPGMIGYWLSEFHLVAQWMLITSELETAFLAMMRVHRD